ncbi:hypothetical protein I4U23_019874 [Adineta vaga]|nr:hypothetical protein I4U23_019874 [Adineta vaga]
MIFVSCSKNSVMIIFSYYSYIIFIPRLTHSHSTYQSLSILSPPGTQFEPANMNAQHILSNFVDSFESCAMQCNMNPPCRIFDYGAIQMNECRLFEGDLGILGAVGTSSMPNSMGGLIQLNPSLFTQYGQLCSSVCIESRYLSCNKNFVCDCILHSYWDASAGMCFPQMTISGAPCQYDMKTCREDLNLTCSPMNQCEVITSVPVPVVGGITVADHNTVIGSSLFIGFSSPVGIAVYGNGDNESLIVVDSTKNEIIHLQYVNSNSKTISVLIRNGTDGISLFRPNYLYLDTEYQNNLYVVDGMNGRVLLLSSMQLYEPPPKNVAGTYGLSGTPPQYLSGPNGITMGNEKSLIIADTFSNRIMLWSTNAASGIMIIGTGDSGSGPTELNSPCGLFFDKQNSLLYVVDKNNHRIQLFNLNLNPPYIGITVAGGNGMGSASNQLNQPSDVWVSEITGTIYIADTGNHRIQCWNRNATVGVTIAGNANGIWGTDSTKLNYPSGLVINKNEIYLYVTDTENQRIQRFDLT